MKQEVTFERVSDENFGDFVYLIERLAEYERQCLPDNKAKIRLRKDVLSDNPKFEAYLVSIDRKFVGYFIFYMTYSSYLALSTLYLEDIFVLEEYRRKDIGQKMFQFCVQQAKERGCGRMEWTVYDWNEPAIKLYRKIKATRLNKMYYRLDREQIENFSD